MVGTLQRKTTLLAYGAGRQLRKLNAAVFLILSPFAASAEPVVIAALGDSLTQGYGLVQEQGFVPQLENWLRDQDYDVVINNAGVSGDTTAGGASRIEWTLTPEVDALIVALGANDLLRGIDPATSRANLDHILATAQGQDLPILLVGVDAPGNYGPDYKAAFDQIYPELATQYGTLYKPDFLGALRSLQETDPTAVIEYLQGDGLHPNASGVTKIVQDMGPIVAQLIAQVGQ